MVGVKKHRKSLALKKIGYCFDSKNPEKFKKLVKGVKVEYPVVGKRYNL